jgi:hypothetical protein
MLDPPSAANACAAIPEIPHLSGRPEATIPCPQQTASVLILCKLNPVQNVPSCLFKISLRTIMQMNITVFGKLLILVYM